MLDFWHDLCRFNVQSCLYFVSFNLSLQLMKIVEHLRCEVLLSIVVPENGDARFRKLLLCSRMEITEK